MRWTVDDRPPTLYTRVYRALMWARRDELAFEGADHTLRVAREQQAKGDAPPTRCTRGVRRVEEWRTDDLRVWTVTPRRSTPVARVVYLHGGGYVHPLTADYWRLVRALTSDHAPAPAEVVVPAYPLAPDATIDDVLPQLVRLYAEVSRADPDVPLLLMGDSAGGALVLVVAATLRDAASDADATTVPPAPAGLVLLSPWLDGTLDEDEVADLEASDPMLAESGLRAAATWWAGERDPADPRVSPVNGRVHDLPPADVFTGAHDILRPAIDRLADLAHRDGARLQVHEVPAMFHVWMTRAIPEARRTRRQLAALVAARTREPGGARGFRSRSPGRRPGGTGGSPPPV